MFNLLVSGNGWAETRDTMPLDRIFEYTEKRVQEQFSIEGNVNLDALKSLPSLFLEETCGDGNKVVRGGTITRARVSGKDIAIEYVYDLTIPLLTNNQLCALSIELDINEFEFNRTHWAVKDVDLFRVLLQGMKFRKQQSKIIQIPTPKHKEINNMIDDDPWNAIANEFGTTKKEFGRKINFVKDNFMKSIIFRDIGHAYELARNGFAKPSVILSGAVIEELLRQYLQKNQIKPAHDKFDEYIKACESEGLLKTAIHRLSDSVRHFRNIVHIQNEKTKKHSISKATAIGAVSIIFTIANDF